MVSRHEIICESAFNQEKALVVGAFSVITNLRMDLFQALIFTQMCHKTAGFNVLTMSCDCLRCPEMALMTAGVRTFPCSVESGDPASIAAAITTIKRQNIYNILGWYLLGLQTKVREDFIIRDWQFC